jgi:hypothetical protein
MTDAGLSFELTKEQVEKYKKWNEEHKKVCKLNERSTIGGRLTFQFTPTGLGVIESVQCACGEKLELTDINDW